MTGFVLLVLAAIAVSAFAGYLMFKWSRPKPVVTPRPKPPEPVPFPRRPGANYPQAKRPTSYAQPGTRKPSSEDPGPGTNWGSGSSWTWDPPPAIPANDPPGGGGTFGGAGATGSWDSAPSSSSSDSSSSSSSSSDSSSSSSSSGDSGSSGGGDGS